ncbi:zinc ribbon domain-containing protein [Craterilacuibacter sp.]|uniref:zinc ribbon domain-containing protein n=1 Tax=Craterilacuibacter sp. TaxID=2870909 RepID=UPI003F38058E
MQSAWGKTRDFAKYKSIRKNKLLIEIAPHHTSQECAHCGNIHPDNRLTQAEFICQCCGHKDHSDANASKVIAARGVALVQSEDYAPKVSQRVMRMRKKALGRDGTSRTDPTQDQTPTETMVSRSARKRTPQRSVKSETSATTPNGV